MQTTDTTSTSKQYIFLSDEKITFPKEDQGIVMPYIEEIDTEEYLEALSKYVDKIEILCAAKLAPNEINIYFKSNEIVDNLLSRHHTLEIKNFTVPIRKISCRKKRILLDCSPSIPHTRIETELSKLHVKLNTGISFIQGKFSKQPGFEHIPLNYHLRHFYADVGENEKLPETVTVSYEEKTYLVRLNIDDSIIASNDPESITIEGEQFKGLRVLSKEVICSQENTTEQQFFASTSHDKIKSDADALSQIQENLQFKIQNQSTSTFVEEVKKIIESNPKGYMKKFLGFIISAEQNKDIKTLAMEYTKNPNRLLGMLKNVRKQLKQEEHYNRLHKIISKWEVSTQLCQNEIIGKNKSA